MKNILTLCLLALSATLLTSQVCGAEDWRSYTGNVDTRWLDHEERKMKLLSDYILSSLWYRLQPYKSVKVEDDENRRTPD